MASKSEKIRDAIVTHQTYIVRLGVGMGNKANETVNNSNKELAAAIALALLDITRDPFKINLKRLKDLKRQIKQIRKPAFVLAESEQTDDLEDLARTESDWTTRVISALALLSLFPLSRIQIDRIVNSTPFNGKTVSGWWEGALDSDVDRAITAITRGIQDGLSTKEIIDSVTGTKTLPGTIKTTENDIESISRTVTTGVSNTTQDTVIKKNAGIDRVQWVSILDGRTSDICRGLSGRVWKIIEAYPKPPAHRSCRSTLSYILRSEPVPDKLNYNQWMKTKSDAFAQETLPKWQYKEWKKGTPLSAFVSKDLQPLTMKEFKAKTK